MTFLYFIYISKTSRRTSIKYWELYSQVMELWEVLFCFVFVLLFLSFNFSTMNMIFHVIKNVKNRLHCDCNMGSLLFALTNYLLEPKTKVKPRCPCHLPNSENTQFFGIKYEPIQRELCERKYVYGVLTYSLPLLPCFYALESQRGTVLFYSFWS